MNTEADLLLGFGINKGVSESTVWSKHIRDRERLSLMILHVYT